MVFSSIVFIFRFLPLAFLIYFLTPKKFKNFVLTVLSLIFYSWGEGKYFLIMIASIAVDYTAGRLIEKNFKDRKRATFILILSIIFNLGMLFLFKYFNFFIENINSIFNIGIKEVPITLPLGISFYTFQTMSYSIDVYRGKVRAEKNIINFAAFVTLFPQLIAGPIVKYSDISCELKDRRVDFLKIEEGVRLFILGLSSKVLIANNIGMLWSEVEKVNVNELSTALAWLGIIAFAFQIYFDFDGYSKMAMGLGRMLGFTFPRNFNYPYISRSISEFWRRWHITLGSWFKEYVYIPLGGNRGSKGRVVFNLFVVWALTGLWHGASYNFILWGLMFFILISVEKMGLLEFLQRHRVFSHIYTIFFLLVGWTLFAISDFSILLEYFKRMFTLNFGESYIYYLRNYGITLILALAFSTPIVEIIYGKIVKNKVLDTAIMIVLFILSVAYLVDATYNPFLYFRF